jgi:alginate O-acetyltransferase complex protein AlgI
MLFNSYGFIFLFLPITFGVFFLLARASHVLAAGWLAGASLFFYGWWNPAYVGLLLGSIAFNYALGMWIAKARVRQDPAGAKRLLAFAVAGDLALLGYYKYANFFIDNLGAVLGAPLAHAEIILPLGISFFTFTQIAFLADTYQGKVKEYNFVHYALFVTYFPHLIAGPILHHAEMMPQFGKKAIYRLDFDALSAGLTMFVIGLFKKVGLADEIAQYVAPVFNATMEGRALTLVDAWFGTLAYTLQIYFDFSGYSDMAVGLSKMIGVKLPLNFNSPYQSVNIIDFWRRWHMTLSRFLRDYLYFPLGGNRKGAARRYANLLITMLLGGLWHGANWTFVIWGGLHGIYLAVNHGWQSLRQRLGHDLARSTRAGRLAGAAVTFLAVVVAWVFFRADSMASAIAVLKAMAGLNGVRLPAGTLAHWGAIGQWLAAHGVRFEDSAAFAGARQVKWTLALLALAWFAPNSQQIMARSQPALGMPEAAPGAGWRWWRWTPSSAWAVVTALVTVYCIASLDRVSEFIYFQF